MKATICIVPHKMGLGGPASFQARLSKALIERGHTVNHDPLDPATSVVLVVGGTKYLGTLLKARANGVRIVQRLNGMNWVHKQKRTGWRHFLRAEINNRILSTIRNMADAIIYQSDFSRNWWNRVYGESKSPNRVIYNGVDMQEFNPTGHESPPHDRYRVLMVEGNLGGGYEQGLETGVNLVKLLNQRMDKPVELMVVGNVSETLKKIMEQNLGGIIWRGVVRREEIASIDRSSHLLYSADVNAACPNSVIEALACGLPVIGFDTGALPELVTGQTGEIAAYGADVWKLQKPNLHGLVDSAAKVMGDLESYRRAARWHAAADYDIQHITDQYLEVLLGG